MDTSGDTVKRRPRTQRKKPKRLRFARGLMKVAESDEAQGHTGSILSVAVSPSGKFVATGGADKKLIIWDAETLKPTKTFTQHRDSVSSLAFTRHISTMSSGEQLFSGSYDRTIKTWSISAAGHAYVETLFGHQDHVTSVGAMAIDQCISVGARDRTARLWKVIDEAQLVFRGGSSKNAPYRENNIDCIAPLPPSHFVTGSDSGSISLWSIHKKKPLYTVPLAHGLDPLPPLSQLSPELDEQTAAANSRHLRQTPRWITALTTLPGTDIVLSGSWDGWIRAWRVSEDKKTIQALGPVGGAPEAVFPSHQFQSLDLADGTTSGGGLNGDSHGLGQPAVPTLPEPLIKGVVNDIAVFERRPEPNHLNGSGADEPPKSKTSKSSSASTKASTVAAAAAAAEPRGLCIVAAVGKEHRLARWKCYADSYPDGSASNGRNGAVVFEVPFGSEPPADA